MKILLDTNIIIHRETQNVIRDDIGVLFRWIDNLHYEKYVHPFTVAEIEKYGNKKIASAFKIKLGSYNVINAIPPLDKRVIELSNEVDKTENDRVDTAILNIQYVGITDIFLTEDKKIKEKARLLGIESKVLSIEEFLEIANYENPSLLDYKILAVRKYRFGNVSLSDPFFDSFREDYIDFEKWYRKKNEEFVYVCQSENRVLAFLYLKLETEEENYGNIRPIFSAKKRMKIGTFKVVLNGMKLGERFIKIIFDNAIALKVDELYVTIFNKSIEQRRLINLLEDFGFSFYGIKTSISGEELVYVRQMKYDTNTNIPKRNFPFVQKKRDTYLVPIYEQYHTNLFPDSILRTESPLDFIENEPFRNAISKVYISRSKFKDLKSGDNIIFYRTGGLYKSVITTIGVVEEVHKNIPNFIKFKELCENRSVFSDEDLKKHWEYYSNLKPFIVRFLYTYSFPKRINMKRLIELAIIKDISSAPRGFELINSDNFDKIIRETGTDESIIIN